MARLWTVADLLADELGIATYDRETSAQAGVAAAIAVRNNPNRIGLLVQNLSINTLYLRPGRPPTSTVGIVLASNEWRSFLYREDFSLPTREWWILASAAASDYYILELLLRRGRESAP